MPETYPPLISYVKRHRIAIDAKENVVQEKLSLQGERGPESIWLRYNGRGLLFLFPLRPNAKGA